MILALVHANRLRAAVFALGVLAVLYVVAGDIAVLQRVGEPTGIVRNGELAEVGNCSPPRPGREQRCGELACELQLVRGGQLPPGARGVAARHDRRGDDAQGEEIWIRFDTPAGPRYGRCLLRQGAVAAAAPGDAQGWNGAGGGS